jgi:magnesium-transporting ATPase (P-type)
VPITGQRQDQTQAAADDNNNDDDDVETINILKELLLELSLRCKAVVACRVSPDQKKEMVKLIKENISFARTLAIGDGANDVAMIQEAHLGVGIRGEEGTQAVNSADFAISQFRFLGDLMLKHGRYNYSRMCGLVCYMFYKNILMSMGMFWFNFNCGFSGQKYFTEGGIQLYNLAYTSIPIILYAIFDIDVDPVTVHEYPQLYQSSVNGDYFTVIIRSLLLLLLDRSSVSLSVSLCLSYRPLSFGHGLCLRLLSQLFYQFYRYLLFIVLMLVKKILFYLLVQRV